uniref:NADH-ubiquinone oxidoreductase chain 5 n=1 Tax=Processina sexmaculata TaxID=2906307 RepID=A0A977XTB0_9HEMI|nr:NADH dehydrogenase subunit 5 [Processina sexmaculata]UXX17586.1 NADH dehydrogenase subunit 5 [Processina sexmaculata]
MLKLNFYLFWFYLMFIISIIMFILSIYFSLQSMVIFLEWGLIYLNSVDLCYVIVLDWLCLMFVSLVMMISSMVILYSINYMSMNSYSSLRFLFLVILFIFSMILMIMSPNLLSIMLGWDGLGLVSYCLVIYYMSYKSYLAGLITCLTNRLGDIGLMISISWMVSFGSWHFIFYNHLFDNILVYFLVFSCFTKSAQIPFSCWLPAAMAAPTPVSSLVHSSTLVTAGVYLLIRFYNQMNFNNFVFLYFSIFTMILSSLCANFEFDLKKIIALSTLSQLGLMMSSLFLGLVDLSFFHLLTHAMFKSLLFLCSGIYIYYMSDNQDIRFMGSVSKMLPFTSCCFNISNMSLCGVPFLSGFYSKDLILEYSVFFNISYIIYFLFYFSLGLTCCYSIRLFYYSMIYSNKFILSLMSEDFSFMKLSIFMLTIFSVVSGSVIMWIINLDMVFIMFPIYLSVQSFFFIFMGVWFGVESFNFRDYLFNLSFYFFNSNMWFMFGYSNYLYNYYYTFSIRNSVLINWGEFYGGSGLSFYLLKFSNLFQFYSMNSIKFFLVSFFIWFLIMI